MDKSARKKTSDVWKSFTSVDKNIVRCNICSKTIPYSGNTTNLRSHLDRNHWTVVRRPTGETSGVSNDSKITSNSTKKSSLPSLPSMGSSDLTDLVKVQPPPQQLEQATVPYLFNKQKPFTLNSSQATAISQGIAEYIITDMKPLTTVEGQGFKNLVKLLEPRYQMVCRNHLLERYVVPMYHNTAAQVKRDLEKGMRHAFTTDGLTSINSESYLTTTCHYIDMDTFQLCSKVLDTKCVHISHTSENLAEEMKAIINKWNLKDPVSVTDNAANIVKACTLADLPHLGCFGHTLNLAVNKCLSVPEVSALIGKCRKLVSVFKQSCLKTSALHEAQVSLDLKTLQVIQDVDTRWNSALAMIKRLLDTLPAIWATLYKDKKYSHLLPNDTDRKNMEDLKDLLSPVEEATVRVSAEKSATASLILPTMERFIKHDFVSKTTDSRLIQKAKDAIKTDLLQRYQSEEVRKLLMMSTVLDPKFKNVLSSDDQECIYNTLMKEMSFELDKVKVKTEQSEPEMNDSVVQAPDSEETTIDVNANEVNPEKKPKLDDDFFDVLFIREEKGTYSKDQIIKTELDRYKLETVSRKQDPIEWWKMNRAIYPNLSLQAIKYLNIPATSVPSERVFSTAGNILHKKRAQLTPENTDMLIFLYHNFKK